MKLERQSKNHNWQAVGLAYILNDSMFAIWLILTIFSDGREQDLLGQGEQRADAAGAAGAVHIVPAGARQQGPEGGQLLVRAERDAAGRYPVDSVDILYIL